MKRASTFLLAALIVAASGAAHAQTIDLNKLFGIGQDLVAATGLSEEEEIKVGREVAGRVLGAAPLVDDPAVQAYVNRVGGWLAAQTERPDLPWHFGVINSSAVNAFAAPGGTVLVTRGLYEILDNEAQLAGVLAHEMGHILRRHHVTVMQKSALLSAGTKAAQYDNRSAFINNLIGAGAEIFARGLDKSAEYEADAIGVVLAARAGYNPYGLVDVLQKLASRGNEDGSLALLFKTHPPPGERLNEVGSLITPRVDTLPAGREPQITRVAAGAGAPAAAAPMPEGARALQEPEAERPAQKPKEQGIGIDAGGILRGIFGR